MNLDQMARDAGAEARDHAATIQAPAPNVIARRSRRGRIAALSVATAVIALAGIGLATALREDPAPTGLQVIDDSQPTDQTTTFVSPRSGYSVEYPDGGETTVTPGTDSGNPFADDDTGPEVDVVETGSGAVFTGASTLLEQFPMGLWATIDDWYDDLRSPVGCGVPRSQQAEITIDGQPGKISECQERIEATVVASGRLYGFTLLHDRSDARALFDAFAATIELTPETAIDFPNLATTFVSPTYGYSFGYLDRGGLEPATELWDPTDQQRYRPDGFDYVDTGFGAGFQGASTEIPDGVSVDAWVDEYVTPMAADGCGVPRSQQAEITIDGQPGRIAECPARIDVAARVEGTVVAGGRLYLFTLLHNSRSDARAFFDAFIATIDLTPETATVR